MNIMKFAYCPMLLGFFLILGMMIIDQYCGLSIRGMYRSPHYENLSGIPISVECNDMAKRVLKRLVIVHNFTVYEVSFCKKNPIKCTASEFDVNCFSEILTSVKKA
uniref:Uncharacterized protein n=1 Tax=Micrurus spixii TaxID=129469 RepID=A0A2D4NHT9_9SAUR